jgi:hypothetical protein
VVNASGTLNACGGTNSDSDRVAAIPSAVFDESYCGKVHSPLIPTRTLLDAFAES